MSIERNPLGRWVWTDAQGARHEQVVVVRAYPVTAPEQGVGVMDAEGHELAWFDRIDAVPDPLQSLLREAIAERERTLVRLEGRRAELVQQLELAWRSVEIARVRVQALSEGAVRSAEAALRVAEAAYRFGERGILEVLDAQRVLRAVRQDLLLARFQLQSSLIELDTLAGRYAGEQ